MTASAQASAEASATAGIQGVLACRVRGWPTR